MVRSLIANLQWMVDIQLTLLLTSHVILAIIKMVHTQVLVKNPETGMNKLQHVKVFILHFNFFTKKSPKLKNMF